MASASGSKQILAETTDMVDTEMPTGMITIRADVGTYSCPRDDPGAYFPNVGGSTVVPQYSAAMTMGDAVRDDMPRVFTSMNGINPDTSAFSGRMDMTDIYARQWAILRVCEYIGQTRYSMNSRGPAASAVAVQIKGISHIFNNGDHHIKFGQVVALCPAPLLFDGTHYRNKYAIRGQELNVCPGIAPLDSVLEQVCSLRLVYRATDSEETYTKIRTSESHFDRQLAEFASAMFEFVRDGHAVADSVGIARTGTVPAGQQQRVLHAVLSNPSLQKMFTLITKEYAFVNRLVVGKAMSNAAPGQMLTISVGG